MSNFAFGAHAIYSPENESRFNERRDSIIDSIQPANIVEKIFADELLHASWEMERVRDNSANTAAEAQLNTAHARASRNWHRSLKQLKTLQSARASQTARLYDSAQRDAGDLCPLADPAKMPKPLTIESEVQ